MMQGWAWSTKAAARRLVQFLILLLVCWILDKLFAVPQSLCCKQIKMFATIVKCFDFYR